MSVCLHGGYYYDNFGDLLLFRIYGQWIRQRTEEDFVYPLVPTFNRARFRTHFPQAYFGRNGRSLPWRGMLFAGGGHFAQNQNQGLIPKWEIHFLRQHFLLTEQCIRKNIPYAIFGVGAGPIYHPFMRRAARRLFEHARIITVRDPESKSFIQIDLGVSKAVTVVPDAAAGLSENEIPTESQHRVNAWINKVFPGRSRKFLGVHFTKSLLTHSDQALKVQLMLTECLKKYPDLNPIIFTDYGSWNNHEAEQFAIRLEREISRPCGLWIFSQVNDLTALISRFSALITPKLHVGIVAYALGKYVESFATDIKTPRFYRFIGRPDQSEMLHEIGEPRIQFKIRRALKAADEEWSVRDQSWNRIKTDAVSQQKMVFDFVEKMTQESIAQDSDNLAGRSALCFHSEL